MGAMRRAKVAVFVHLVWSTWDRAPLLTADLRRAVHRAIEAKSAELGATVVAIGGMEEHVHLLVKLPATLTIAQLAGQVKGASAHLVNHHFNLGGAFRWQGAYAAFSVGPGAVPRVVQYIANQREHHGNGTLIADWEQPRDEIDAATVA